MPPEVTEPADKLIEELYDFTDSLGVTLIDTNDTDVSVLTAQRFYGRIPSTPVEMALDYWYNDFTSAGVHHIRLIGSVSLILYF